MRTLPPAPAFAAIDFFNELNVDQQALSPIDVLQAFETHYRDGHSLTEFVMAKAKNARYTLKELNDMALILKDVVNKINGWGISEIVLEETAKQPVRVVPNSSETPSETYTDFLDQIIRTNSLAAFQTEIELISRKHLHDIKIPDAAELTYWPSFNAMLCVIRTFTVMSGVNYLYRNRHMPVDHKFMTMMFLSTFLNLMLSEAPDVVLNSLMLPLEYFPKNVYSKGMAEYVRFLRTLHYEVYHNITKDYFRDAAWNAWIDNRDAQKNQYYLKAPHLIVGSVLAFPIIGPFVGPAYGFIKDQLMLRQQVLNPDAKDDIQTKSNSYGYAIINLVIFTGTVYGLNYSNALWNMMNDKDDPKLNNFVKSYLHFWTTVFVSTATLIACREGPGFVQRNMTDIPRRIAAIPQTVRALPQQTRDLINWGWRGVQGLVGANVQRVQTAQHQHRH